METQILVRLVTFLFEGTVVYRLIRWVQTVTAQPDPWDSEVEESVDEAEPTLTCARCLTPNSVQRDFS
jgi:hypothetical protein